MTNSTRYLSTDEAILRGAPFYWLHMTIVAVGAAFAFVTLELTGYPNEFAFYVSLFVTIIGIIVPVLFAPGLRKVNKRPRLALITISLMLLLGFITVLLAQGIIRSQLWPDAGLSQIPLTIVIGLVVVLTLLAVWLFAPLTSELLWASAWNMHANEKTTWPIFLEIYERKKRRLVIALVLFVVFSLALFRNDILAEILRKLGD